MTTDIKREFPVEHSRIGPSSAERWMACPGSPALTESLPRGPETSYQHEGNMAHALADYCLTKLVEPMKADVTYGGEAIPNEMREAVQFFYETVLATMTSEFKHNASMYVEARVTLAGLQPPEAMYGTADVILVGARRIHVFDLKYGRGVTVAGDTPQGGYYALGAALMALRGDEEWEDRSPAQWINLIEQSFDSIRVTIVQPRQGDAVRTSTLQDTEDEAGETEDQDFTPGALREFAARLLMAAERAHAPDAPLVAGEQCRFCPAKAFCPAIKSYAMVAAQTDFDVAPVVGPPAVETLTIAQAADYLSKVPVLTAWAAALKERIEEALQRGEDVPGFKLVDKRARRYWIDGAAEQKQVLKLGSDAYETPELKSPAQMEKMLGKKQFAALMGPLVGKRSTGTTMAPDSDPRPAVGRLPAQVEFAGYLPVTTDETM
jgi:hypothetical protein